MGNIFENRISTTFTDKELTALAAQRSAYMEGIRAKTVALTEEELASLSSMAVDNFVFVKDTLQATDGEGLSLLPPAIGILVPELEKDAALFGQLDEEELFLRDMLMRVQHTRRLAAHECYQVASAIYRQYQHLAEAGVPGAMTRYNGLKSRFAGNGGGRPKDEATV